MYKKVLLNSQIKRCLPSKKDNNIKFIGKTILSIVLVFLFFKLIVNILNYNVGINNIELKDLIGFDGLELFVIVPLVETFLFQYLIILIIFKISKKYKLAIIISTIVFSLFHIYSFLYFVWTLFIGFILSSSFVDRKTTQNYPFIVTTIIHSLTNILIVFINYIIEYSR